MKTLDEVIRAWSICFSDDSQSDCTGCPYADEDGNAACFNHDREDALHYLKEYRWVQENCADALAEKYPSENVPLTWDELKQMEGKPVWVEVDGKWWGRFWAFVEVGSDSYINFFQKGQEYPEDLWKSNMGKTWNAFRKERE